MGGWVGRYVLLSFVRKSVQGNVSIHALPNSVIKMADQEQSMAFPTRMIERTVNTAAAASKNAATTRHR